LTNEEGRTTVDLTPEAYHLARALAREKEQSLGRVVSELILRPVGPAVRPGKRSAAGFPLFSSGRPITAEDVRAALDDE